MANALARRGPDGQNTWANASIGLVHTVLHSTLESLTEQQPLDLDKRIWITADARIDNQAELRRLLAAKGSGTILPVSDADYIIQAYHIWKRDCVNYLIGDFAFAIWDSDENTLFCARDHFGVRPFYYYCDHRVFVFGSEVRAILAFPQVKCSPSEARIADYLVQELEGIDATSTFYEGIYRLPPGHTLLVEPGRVSIDAYWRMESPAEIRYRHNEDYVEAFLEKFSRAVQCRLRAPSYSQVGAMLSGGLDSSSIVGIARESYQQQGFADFRTFSAVAPDESDVETHFINSVIAQGGLNAVRIKPDDIRSYMPELSYLLNHATDLYDHWMEIPQLMYIAARKSGVKVLLTGIGGDEFASLPPSYPRYMMMAGHLRQAIHEIIGTHRFYSDPFWRVPLTVLRQVYTAFMPTPIRAFRQTLLKPGQLDKAIESTIVNPVFAERIKLRERLGRLWESRDVVNFKTIRSEQLLFIRHPYLAVGLERYDRVAATHGVETRHPYLDKNLAEFLYAIPPEQLRKNGWSKMIVRHAMRHVLSDEVRFRRGHPHLGLLFQRARFQLEVPRFDKFFAEELGFIEPYVDIPKIRAAWRERHSDTNASIDLWRALTLALWLKQV